MEVIFSAIQIRGRGYPLLVDVESDNLLKFSYNGGTVMAITSAGLVSAATSSGTDVKATTVTATNLTAGDTIVTAKLSGSSANMSLSCPSIVSNEVTGFCIVMDIGGTGYYVPCCSAIAAT